MLNNTVLFSSVDMLRILLVEMLIFLCIHVRYITTGFPPIREIREIRENFEDFFQSGKSGKNRGFSAKIREKNFKSGNF